MKWNYLVGYFFSFLGGWKLGDYTLRGYQGVDLTASLLCLVAAILFIVVYPLVRKVKSGL